MSVALCMPGIVEWSWPASVSLSRRAFSHAFSTRVSGPCAALIRAASDRTPASPARWAARPAISIACAWCTIIIWANVATQSVENRAANRGQQALRRRFSGSWARHPRKWRVIVQDLAARSGLRAGREPGSQPRAAGPAP
jgi:hypothetical protein